MEVAHCLDVNGLNLKDCFLVPGPSEASTRQCCHTWRLTQCEHIFFISSSSSSFLVVVVVGSHTDLHCTPKKPTKHDT